MIELSNSPQKKKSELANSRSELDPKKSELDPFLDRVKIFEKWVGQLKTRGGAHGPEGNFKRLSLKQYLSYCFHMLSEFNPATIILNMVSLG